MKSGSSPTLKDVAKEAGVSVMTASSVLNASRSSTRVSDATRQRIEEVAQRLSYVPNAVARGLARGRTQVLGVVFGGVSFETTTTMELYAANILQGIGDGCGERDYNVMLFTRSASQPPRTAMAYRNRNTDGLVVIAPPTDNTLIPDLVALGIRVVAVSYPGKALQLSDVDVDNAQGVALAMEHLLALGHRKIAFLSGTPELQSAGERLGAFHTARTAAGIAPRPEYLTPARSHGDPDEPFGSYSGRATYADTRHLLAMPAPPTAILAGNDRMALEALRAARDAGVSVPEQLSIVGFDDRLEASLVTPGLTTIRQPLLEIGREAARLLIEEIAHPGETTPTQSRLAPSLIVRGTTAPAH
jgi:LacI family transcriptional regulator